MCKPFGIFSRRRRRRQKTTAARPPATSASPAAMRAALALLRFHAPPLAACLRATSCFYRSPEYYSARRSTTLLASLSPVCFWDDSAAACAFRSGASSGAGRQGTINQPSQSFQFVKKSGKQYKTRSRRRTRREKLHKNYTTD